MRTIHFLILLAPLLAVSTAAPAQEVRPSTFSGDQIRAILRDKVDRDRRSVGMVVGVVDENGTQVFSYGRCCSSRRGRIDGDTIFEIGSLTKPITQAVFADMVARGEVSPSDPISRYLPSGVRTPTEGGREITLQHLVEHTSGLPRMPDDYPAEGNDYSVERLHAFLGRYRLPRAPGAQREYSNVGYGLLAHLLARRAGMSFAELVRRRITGPLRMSRTYFTTPQALREGAVAQGHDVNLMPHPATQLGPAIAGSGGLKSTINDMLRFLSASMGLAGRQVPTWGRLQDVRGRQLIAHDGSTAGFAGYMAWDPARRRGVVILANSNHVPIDFALHLLEPLVPLMPRRVPVVLARTQLDSYTGTFQAGAQAINLFRYNDRLFLERGNQPPREIYAEAPGRLYIDDARPIVVETDGAATSLRLYQLDGGSVSALRTGPATSRFTDMAPSEFGSLTGTYEISPGLLMSVTQQGAALFAQIANQAALELVPIGRTRFRYLQVEAEVEFTRDGSGATTGLTIYQSGETTPARRLPPAG
jgi:CubicO group peptidase (beta-lactamase class C family)